MTWQSQTNMYRYIASICLCIAATAVPQRLAAQETQGDTRSRQSSDSATIAALERQVEDAVVRRNAVYLDSIYAPTFRFKHSTGTLESRERRMASLRRPVPANAPGRTISRAVDSTDVEVHGDVALSTGRIHVIRDGGDPKWQNYTVRYARVWRRDARTGRWQLLTHHTTSESHGPPEPIRP
jgi:hypothetical protein